jgi:[acyl-carrier-protein] S-malonyltransferase
MVRLAILCPGQGHQHAHMFRFIPETIASLEPYLTASYPDLMRSSELLFKNQNAQVLVVAAGYANWLKLKPYIPDPIAFLGYSVGELTAFACAGAINADDLLPLAHSRALIMDKAKAKQNASMGMLAVTDIDLKIVSICCRMHQVYIAIHISKNSFVLGGIRNHLEEASRFIKGRGGHVKILPIDLASHTPLMSDASNGFKKVLCATHFHRHFTPVISNLTGEKITTDVDAKIKLAKQLSHTLVFNKCLQVLSELLPTCVLELGPGRALANMFQNSNPNIPCRSMEEFRTIQGVVEWINKYS